MANLSQINTNIAALNALNALNNINQRLSVHQLRLATGKRINSAADDAAGFSIANKFTARIAGLGAALGNIGDAKNLVTVAEGHLTNINDILAQMKSKASQAATDTLGTDERAAILEELEQFNSQIDLEVIQAQWSGVDVLGTGDAAPTDISFQIGAGTTSSNELVFNVAEQIWAGGATNFNSAGLDVVASSTSVDTATAATLTSDYTSIAMATGATLLGGLSELSSGYYTIEVSTASAVAASILVNLTLRDSNGDAVNISALGAGSSSDTSLATTIAEGGGSPAAIDLGVGITVALTGVAGATTEGAQYGLTYTQGGNTVGDQTQAQAFMDQIDDAMSDVATALTYIGAVTGRLGYQEQSITVAKTNTEAARSRIMDADMAWEQLESTKLQILQQTATAMLAQANVAPQAILTLFR